MKILTTITFVAVVLSASAQRPAIDLSGVWQTPLGKCSLPGTTDENRLGDGKHPTDVTSQLTRLYPYAGQLTYERDFVLPAGMAGKRLSLILERTKPSTLWIDGDSIGSIRQLYAPHRYLLPDLAPGTHHIKLRIDNSNSAVPGGVRGSHAWTDATQTNWNGILGRMVIEATDPVYFSDMQIYPDVDKKQVEVKLCVESPKTAVCDIELRVDGQQPATSVKADLSKGSNTISATVPMGSDVKLWNEFHPNLYTMTASLSGDNVADVTSATFGMRDFKTDGTQFVINGDKTFLRGTHDACVFPLTAYCPTDVDEWRRTFRIAKEYGINHYRFHSYTPTEAAFQAADELGVYLHPELPLWGGIDRYSVEQNEFLRHEAFTMLKEFGNHPSFVSMGLGNEISGDTAVMHQWLDDFRAVDSRHLYSMGANNDLGWKGPKIGDDMNITCRVGGGEGTSTHTRTSFSFADADGGGILNTERPNTRRDFSYPVSLCPTPIVSHESAQFQIYPDYTEIPKYTGVLYPYNLEIFRERLRPNGMTPQINDFHMATGLWAVECYKADMETCLRTPGFGGYQLLDIKDYPGQGTALVGILDAFMDSKGLVTPSAFSNWNSEVVPMALTDSLCYSTKDTLVIDLAISNYSEDSYNEPVIWSINNGNGYERKGVVDNVSVKQGDVSTIGRISLPLSEVGQTSKLSLVLTTGRYANSYKLWVYDEAAKLKKSNVMVADTLDGAVAKALAKGRTVILSPRHADIESRSVGGMFTPDYWNYAMFKTISESINKPVSPGTLGMLMDPKHPMFATFPTDGHTDWQWWTIALNSRPLILDPLDKEYFPVIQTVDNVERNHKLGILMEFKVGKGRLLLTTTDLSAIAAHPEGRAYVRALKAYANSADFQPRHSLSTDQLRELLYSSSLSTRDINGVENKTDYRRKD